MKQHTTGLLAQKQRPRWNQKTAIKNFLARYNIKFDMEADAIDLRTMAQNYPNGIIPLEDIHQGLMAILGPNYNPITHTVYDPTSAVNFSPKFAYVKWSNLYLYSIFQRDVAANHIAKIYKDWDHTAVLIPCAIKFTINGVVYYCVWDGHHTLQTARIMNYAEFPCWYIDIDEVNDSVIEAAGFPITQQGRIDYGCWLAGRNMIRINSKNKRPLHHYDEFMILLETKDKKAMDMDRIISTTNCVPRRRSVAAGAWTQIRAGEECFDLLLGNGLPSKGVFWQHALEFHRRVWTRAPLILEMFRPLSYLYQACAIGNYTLDVQFDQELENILVNDPRMGDPDSVQRAIKESYENAVLNNLGRGHLLKNDREIVMDGLINIYNQKCGRVLLPQPNYVWNV